MKRNVAIIGAGIGGEHLAAYLTLPDRFAVCTVCDLDEVRAEGIASTHGIDVTTDFQTVLDDPAIDIVDICLPPHLHLSASFAALEAGKTVICEKPIASSLAEVDALISKAETCKGTVFPVFQYRFGVGMAQLRHLIELGIAGRCYVGTLETHWNRDANYYANPWRGTWAGENGGALLGHAIHIHDLLTAVLGPVSRVQAETATRVNRIETEDCAALALKMENGALVTSSVTLGAADDTSRLRFMFESFTVESDHAAYAPAANPWRFTARAPVTQQQIDKALAEVASLPFGFPGFLHAIADKLDGLRDDTVTLKDGRRSLEFVAAAYHAARTGTAVDLPLDHGHPLYHSWHPETKV